MIQHEKLFTETSTPLLAFIKKIPLRGSTIDTSLWDTKVSKLFECFIYHEIFSREKVHESIRGCIQYNARKSREELKRGKTITEIQSPEALAYAMKHLGYNPSINFIGTGMSENVFLHKYLSHLEKEIKDQLYYKESPSLIVFY